MPAVQAECLYTVSLLNVCEICNALKIQMLPDTTSLTLKLSGGQHFAPTYV